MYRMTGFEPIAFTHSVVIIIVIIGVLQCVKALLYQDQGTAHLNVDAQDDFGDTPLHIAAKWGFSEYNP